MKIPREEIRKILSEIEISSRDNSDNVLMGDTRGDRLYCLHTEKVVDKLLSIIEDNATVEGLQKRLQAAEDFIYQIGGGGHYTTWEMKFEAYKKWKETCE